jgi:dTDP-4-amino-4,6-dideoxygalactose transaminase
LTPSFLSYGKHHAIKKIRRTIVYRIGENEIEAIARVIRGGMLFRINDTQKEAEQFEKELADKLGVKYALALSGGTSALIGALVGIGAGPGDEVLVPAYTFMATAIAVLAVGAIPVLVEIDQSHTMDIDDMMSKISQYTKAVIPVHMRGFPCDMEGIMKAAEEKDLKVIEDACQADGGSYRGKRLGTIGDVGCLSFNHYKIISSGEGGAIVTDDREAYERVLVYHDGGCAFRPYAKEIKVPIFSGVQNRISEITGAMLREQLKRLDPILTDLRSIKKQIMEELEGETGVKFLKSNDIAGDCGTQLGFLFDSEKEARRFAEKSEGSLAFDSGKHVYVNWEPIMQKRGAHHPALDPYRMPENAGRSMDYSPDMCPKTLDILKRSVYINLHPDMDKKDVERIVSCVRSAAAVPA